jgi:hypothetical protein
MKQPLLLLLLSTALLSGCESSTRYSFTGSITRDGQTQTLSCKAVFLFYESGTQTNMEWRYVLEKSDTQIVVKAPRLGDYRNYCLISPSNAFGVFLRDSKPSGLPVSPLYGRIQFDQRNGLGFTVNATNDTQIFQGQLSSRDHVEFHPILGVGMLVSPGCRAEPPDGQVNSLDRLITNAPPASAGVTNQVSQP